jgi:hypothetical protein
VAESPQALETPQTSLEPPEPVRWLRSRPVLAIGLLLILANVWWKASFLGKSFFRADDYFYLEHASTEGLNFNYLFWVDGGHLDVVGSAIAWFVQRASPDDWTLASAVTLVLLACTCIALLRMLRTLFGDRPGILLVLALYMLSPLSLPGLSWWTVTLEQLPLQFAIFCAVTAHVLYLQTRRYRHAIAAAAWLVVAMLSSFQGAAGSLLLFALTSAFFAVGPWSRALWRVLRAHWRAWLLYAVLTAAYVPLYVARLRTSSIGVTKPTSVAEVTSYAGTLVRDTFVPGVFGGPWRWSFSGIAALTNPPPALAWLSWVLAILVVVISLMYAWDAWRAWAILAGWLVVVDIVPVLAGRSALLPGSMLGTSARYVWDATGILALCVGLAFMPLVGSLRPVRSPRRLGRAESAAATTVVVAVVFGSLWSYYDYPADPTVPAASSYIATARTALADAPSDTVIVDNPVPPGLTGGPFFGQVGMASSVLSPMLTGPPGSRPRFITQPDGTYSNNLLEFNPYGQLVPAGIVGGYSMQPRPEYCWPTSDGLVAVPLNTMAKDANTLQIGYFSDGSGQLLISFGSQFLVYNFQRGLNNAFLAVHGASGDMVVIQHTSGAGLCIGNAAAGDVWWSS